MATTFKRPLKKLSHTRDVNNYIRKKVIEGKRLEIPEDRDFIIKEFLSRYTTGPRNEAATMSPELFAFFLQKLNAHGLYENLDNENYTIVFPTYIPFDVEAEAAKYGFNNIYTRIETNLRKRSSSVGEVKTASAIYAESEDKDLFDKVASASANPEEVIMSDVGKDYKLSGSVRLGLLRDKAASMYWLYKNIDDFAKTAAFSADPMRRKIYEDIKKSSIRGNRDKTAGLSDFNSFINTVDEIIEISSPKPNKK